MSYKIFSEICKNQKVPTCLKNWIFDSYFTREKMVDCMSELKERFLGATQVFGYDEGEDMELYIHDGSESKFKDFEPRDAYELVYINQNTDLDLDFYGYKQYIQIMCDKFIDGSQPEPENNFDVDVFINQMEL